MVPKVAAKGTSFKGAGLYYLHDKQAGTADRVVFTHTENLPTANPEYGLKCMAYTALHQNEIKAASGVARTGRKLTQPVYAYSLSWAPDEQPTQEQMIEAGRETLRALGLENHEVLMVAHNDEPHPHLHLIVNRVHPETGKAAALSNDRLALSRWAEEYERRHGKIRCEQRVINNEARRKGQFVKDRRSLDPAAFHRWRRDRLKGAFAVREATEKNLSAYHTGQRQALYDEKELRIRQLRQDIRERNRPKWAALYRQQKAERRQLEVFQASAVSRLAYWLKNRDLGQRTDHRRGSVSGAVKAITGRHEHREGLAARHEAQRTELADTVRAQTQKEIRDVNRRYQAGLDKLKGYQAQERGQLQQEHSRQSQDGARDIREGRDEQQFRKETGKTLSSEFARRVRDRIKETQKRRKDERARGKDAGREREP